MCEIYPRNFGSKMTSKGKRPLRSLTPSDKVQAIQRIHDGESKASVARDIGVPESTLRGWCKNEDKLRFMSRQLASDKLNSELSEKVVDGATAAAVGLLTGSGEKRQKLEVSSLPLNFSSKVKYEDLAYKRNTMNGLDFGPTKTLPDLSFNSLASDYGAFQKAADLSSLNGSSKTKSSYSMDLGRQTDPSAGALNPLTSLSHLSGLTGLSHSPLAISFSELTSNLNLIAQLNPGLAAMSGINGLHSSTNSLRSIKPKPATHSPRNNDNDNKPSSLSVKNWAKQKPPSSQDGHVLNLNDNKSKLKPMSPPLSQTMNRDSAMEDPLLYWLKSQQAMLSLNNLYTPNPSSSSSPPPQMRSSTPQQQHQNSTPPISSTSQTPSSTLSGISSDDTKNSAWYNWCKALGASLLSDKPPLTPHNLLSGNIPTMDNGGPKPQFENILYSHLTKEHLNNPEQDNLNNNEIIGSNKPEDLSAKKMFKTESPSESPVVKSEADTVTSNSKDVLDNLLYKINNTAGSESDGSYTDSINNNNKPDIEKDDYCENDDIDGPAEALEHGEKFLKWLENCGNPRITAVQLMQLRLLIAAIRSSTSDNSNKHQDNEYEQRNKIRRRK